jgi:hypothetical protein
MPLGSESTANICVDTRRRGLLLIGLAQFVPLQISKIEPICVAAWAARTIIPGLSRKQIRQCRW